MFPANNHSFKISRTALAIVIAALLLAVLLAILTIRNIKREENLMTTFLLHEGLTLIRSFEAGARTTMMHHMEGDEPLVTLVTETVKEPLVAYIRIVNENGEIVAASGAWLKAARPSIDKILSSPAPITTRLESEEIFEVARPFTQVSGDAGQKKMMGRWGNNCGVNKSWPDTQQNMVIYLGLHTGEFDQARHVDVKHALLLGGILFLVGSAGLYFIFLYQEMRVGRRTLADMELYTKNVIESTPAGLITLDGDARVVSCNSRAEMITGKSFAELDGKVLAEELENCPVLGPEGEIMVEQPFTCNHSDGSSVPVRVSTSVLHDGKGRVSGLVLILRDVREVFDIEQKLEQSRRLAALGRMATGIAHEIRNPLGTLRGFAQLFARKFTGHPTEQEYAHMMVDEVDRLDRTVSALLQFARPREPELQQICLNEVMAKTVKFMGDDLKAQAIEFRLELPARKIMMQVDPDLLQQVLLNLLHNALAASGRGGMIELGASCCTDDTSLWVADNGKGMSLEDKSQMFDPFFTTKKTGTGLGLTVVHQIVSQHGGSLEVDSELGQGTRVKIVFPQPARTNT